MAETLAAPLTTFNPLQTFISFGFAGVILAALVVPLQRWIMAELTAQRLAFMQHIDMHEKQEIDMLGQIKTVLQSVADAQKR